MGKMLSAEEIGHYRDEGYLICRSFWPPAVVERLMTSATGDKAVRENALDLNDQEGKKTKLTLWFTPGDDVFGLLSRSQSVIQAVDTLMEGKSAVCHFHSKLMQKEPRVGGAWEWHQDYGYWYKNQFLFPDQMISVMLALSQATKENGCLQFIPGSHKLGRVNHGFSGEQVGADMEMVAHALRKMSLQYAELEPGDVLFFHPNLLHRSAANLSDHARWSIISCYNRLSNPAYQDESAGWRQPLQAVPDDAMLNRELVSLAKADFLKKENDPALKQTGWEDEVKTN